MSSSKRSCADLMGSRLGASPFAPFRSWRILTLVNALARLGQHARRRSCVLKGSMRYVVGSDSTPLYIRAIGPGYSSTTR